MDEVRVSEIIIENVRAIGSARLRFGAPRPGEGELIVLKGKTGVGKTSLIDAAASALSGGKEPNLISHGAEKAQITMRLSDGTQIIRKHTRKDSYTDIIGVDELPVKSPRKYIEGLTQEFAFDPLAFCTAEPKKRMEYLLKVLPIKFTADEVLEKLGKAAGLLPTPEPEMDINALTRFQKTVQEKRAAIGNKRDERASSVETFRKTLATNDHGPIPRDWKQELADLRARRDALESAEREQIDTIQMDAKANRDKALAELRQREDAARAEFDRVMGLIAADKASIMKKIDDAEVDSFTEIRGRNAIERQDIASKVATAEAGLESQTKTNTIRSEMNRLQGECSMISAQYEAVDKADKALEALRQSRLENLPVKGLEFRDGLIYVNGTNFDDLCGREQFFAAFQIGSQGCGSMAFAVCDGGERINDGASLEAFREAVVEQGWQVVLTCVTAGPLTAEPAEALVLA